MKRLRASWTIVLASLALALCEVAAFVTVRRVTAMVGDVSLPPRSSLGLVCTAAMFVVAVIAAFAFSSMVGAHAARGAKVPFAAMAIVACALTTFAALAPPIGSADNYSNTLMMRGWVQRGADPYTATPNDFSDDLLYPHTPTAWRGTSVVYGPLWSVVAAFPVFLTDEVSAQLAAMKGLNAAAYLVAGALLYKRFRRTVRPGVAEASFAFWLFNPAAVFEVANAGHNEGLLVLALSFTAIALADDDAPRAAIGVSAAALIKLWPVGLIVALLGPRRSATRWSMSVVIVALMIFACLVPFILGDRGSDGVVRMVTAPFQNAMGDGTSPRPFFFAPFRFTLLAVALLGGATMSVANAFAGIASLVACGAVALAATVGRLRGSISGLDAAILVMVAVFGFALAYVQPWYLLALLPFVFARDRGSPALVMAALAVMGFGWYLTGPGLFLLAIIAVAPLVSSKTLRAAWI